MTKKETLKEFIAFYNNKDLKKCTNFFSEDIELRSTYALQIYPESEGVLNGKEAVIDYLELIFKILPNLESLDYTIEDKEEYFIASGDNADGTLNYYLHYYLNDANLIYKIMSNLTRPE